MKIEWCVAVRRGQQVAHAFDLDTIGPSLCRGVGVIHSDTFGAAQSFDRKCRACEQALTKLTEKDTLLREFAEANPIVEDDRNGAYCFHCGTSAKPQRSLKDAPKVTHKPTCPWKRARKTLGLRC